MFDSVAALMGSTDPDGDVSLSGLVERLAAAPPGPTVIGMLAGLPVGTLDSRDRALVLRAWERQAAWLASAQQQALLGVAGTQPSDDDDFTEIEIGAALRMSPTTAGNRVRIARALATRLPATAAALERGEVSYLQAMAIAEETAPGPCDGPGEELSAEQLAAVEATVLRRAERLTVAETRRAVRRCWPPARAAPMRRTPRRRGSAGWSATRSRTGWRRCGHSGRPRRCS